MNKEQTTNKNVRFRLNKYSISISDRERERHLRVYFPDCRFWPPDRGDAQRTSFREQVYQYTKRLYAHMPEALWERGFDRRSRRFPSRCLTIMTLSGEFIEGTVEV